MDDVQICVNGEPIQSATRIDYPTTDENKSLILTTAGEYAEKDCKYLKNLSYTDKLSIIILFTKEGKQIKYTAHKMQCYPLFTTIEDIGFTYRFLVTGREETNY